MGAKLLMDARQVSGLGQHRIQSARPLLTTACPAGCHGGYDAVLVGRAEHHLGRVGPWALPGPVTVRRPTSQSPGASPSPVPPSSHHAVVAQQKRQIPSCLINPVLPFPSISTSPSSPAKPAFSSCLSSAVGSARPCAVLHVACTTLLQAKYTLLRSSHSPPACQPARLSHSRHPLIALCPFGRLSLA
jgi:hypothetical protein